LVFVVHNIDLYHSMSQTHDINTRRNFDLYHPHSNLMSYQKGLTVLVLSFLMACLYVLKI